MTMEEPDQKEAHFRDRECVCLSRSQRKSDGAAPHPGRKDEANEAPWSQLSALSTSHDSDSNRRCSRLLEFALAFIAKPDFLAGPSRAYGSDVKACKLMPTPELESGV